MNNPQTPYTTLGKQLKFIRERCLQTLAEVSGAVEIDEQLLARFENGQERPEEDILLLLISHFGMPGQEALQLWSLADYGREAPEQLRQNNPKQEAQAGVVMLVAMDMRIQYSDGLDILTTPAGLSLTFTQLTGPQQSVPIARIGMSYPQAEQVMKQLERALLRARYLRGPLALPPPQSDTKPENNT